MKPLKSLTNCRAPLSSRWLWLTVIASILAANPFWTAHAQRPSATAALPAAATTATPAIARDQTIIAEVRKNQEIMTNLTYISDMIGPRLTGSAALKRANDWTAEKMKSYGLSNVHLEAWTIPAGWERGTARGRIIEPDNGRGLSLAAMGWSPGTNGKIVGDVVPMTAKNSKELAKYKGKLKGAIVLRGAPSTIRPISGERSTRARQGSGFNVPPGAAGRSMERTFAEMMAFRREMMDFLRTEGVAVVLQDAGKPQGLLATTGQWRGGDRASAPDPIAALFVAHEHYALLYRLATRPAPARTRVELEVANTFIPGPIVVYNTVGEIPGSKTPGEFVVLGAHLDSWDLAQGTTDNGTGSVVVLEAARALVHTGIKPERTIRFVLFTGEEQGLFGSKAYVQKHKDEMPRTSLCLVHDTGTGKVIGLGLQGRDAVKPILEKELASLKSLGVTEINLRSMPGSDHMSFEQAGVPGFACQQDMGEYFLSHHSQSDTLDKAHEPDLIQGAQVMAVTAVRVANLPALLPRDKLAPKKVAEKPSTPAAIIVGTKN